MVPQDTGQNKTILAVDSNPDVLQMISEYFANTHYEVVTAETGDAAKTAMRTRVQNQPPILLLNLSVGAESGSDLAEFLVEHHAVAGIILTSQAFNPREGVQSLIEKCETFDIPFFELTTPLKGVDLDYLLDRIELHKDAPDQHTVEAAVARAIYRRRFTYLYAGRPGNILRKARETFGLDIPAFTAIARANDLPISDEFYTEYEQHDKSGERISATHWFYLCELLEISTDSISFGYCERLHLGRIRHAINEDTIRLPVSDDLKSRLEALRKMEEKESKEFERAFFQPRTH